jgi:hypothetical protein
VAADTEKVNDKAIVTANPNLKIFTLTVLSRRSLERIPKDEKNKFTLNTDHKEGGR